jgi:hypothetical protein
VSADLEAQARRTLENLADSMAPRRPSVEDLVRRDARQIQSARPRRRGWQPLTRVAAAVVLLVGAAVTFVVLRAGSRPTEQPPTTLLMTTPTTVSPPPTSPAPATSTPTDGPEVFDGIPWYVPSSIPDGYEVFDTRAHRSAADVFVSSMTWSSSGTSDVTGRLRVRAFRVPGQSIPAGDQTVQVHGVNAEVSAPSSGEPPSVGWFEQGLSIEVESDIEDLDLVALAERTIVEAATGATLPAEAVPQGLELVTDVPPSPPRSSPADVSVTLRNAQANVMTLSITPNVQHDSLATIVVAPTALPTLEVIGSHERLVLPLADQSGATTITWFESGFKFSARGNASTPEDDLRSFVAGLRPGNVEDFTALAETTIDATLEIEPDDTATFDDGTRVSVHELTSDLTDSDRLAPAICLRIATATCSRQRFTTEQVATGPAITEVGAVLRIDGQLQVVYWLLQPVSDLSASVSGTGASLPVETSTGSVGTFARVILPPDTASIDLTFTTVDPSMPEVRQVDADNMYFSGP